VVLPPFDENGGLPTGDYVLTLNELQASFLVTGDGVKLGPDAEWARAWREKLVKQLRTLVSQLQAAGVTDIFIDGSFATDKPRPNDIDGYFIPSPRTQTGSLRERADAWDQVRGNLLKTSALWDWSPSSLSYHPDTRKKERAQWHRFRVDLWPHVPGVIFAEYDAKAHRSVEFPEFFRRHKVSYVPRGIIRIGGLT
jgi:hypothetical protein